MDYFVAKGCKGSQTQWISSQPWLLLLLLNPDVLNSDDILELVRAGGRGLRSDESESGLLVSGSQQSNLSCQVSERLMSDRCPPQDRQEPPQPGTGLWSFVRPWLDKQLFLIHPFIYWFSKCWKPTMNQVLEMQWWARELQPSGNLKSE